MKALMVFLIISFSTFPKIIIESLNSLPNSFILALLALESFIYIWWGICSLKLISYNKNFKKLAYFPSKDIKKNYILKIINFIHICHFLKDGLSIFF